VIQAFGDKVQARQLMREAGLPVIPGTAEPVLALDPARDAAAEIGYPVMLKAAAGGGGRGMRVARDAAELARQFDAAQMEAQSAFGNGALYLEKLLEGARHVEVQLAADNRGQIVHLGERDCSVQRRHQKLIEEAPAPLLDDGARAELGGTAVRGAASVGYRGLGTMEFLLDRDGRFWFLETNCRIQVEHGVTEQVSGYDLVKEQIRLAAGESLSWSQSALHPRGHAIECRITAEDPTRDFAPAAGTIETLLLPGGPGVRVDTHVYQGYEFPPLYDSLLAKVICWGQNRQEALARMARALRETRVGGLQTNLTYLQQVIADPRFQAGGVGVDYRLHGATAERPAAGRAAVA
jgi:acetyl-CoA carboxylase biotin carboxylase subunit